jgi:hypothetical protein
MAMLLIELPRSMPVMGMNFAGVQNGVIFRAKAIPTVLMMQVQSSRVTNMITN